ncbi:MAG: MBL fold metallo-hydrolase [Candidatus Ancillula trichonymphae]|nr:MBL fold metallo-hydrolase [Candidatus Ancillula trichonymphae]
MGGVVRIGAHSGIVIDVGPKGADSNGCLQKLGISKIDMVVLSHYHDDHVGNLEDTHSGGVELFPLHFWIRSSNQSRNCGKLIKFWTRRTPASRMRRTDCAVSLAVTLRVLTVSSGRSFLSTMMQVRMDRW